MLGRGVSLEDHSNAREEMMGRSVVAIGNFDGVHTGHQTLLRRAAELAIAHGEPAQPLNVIVVTFWPHPLTIVAPDIAPKLLASLPDRIDLLRKAGADEVRVVQFTSEVVGWSPEHFAETIIKPLEPEVVVVGKNFTFGKGAAGTAQTLAELGADSFTTEIIDLSQINQTQTCSTLVRNLVAQGDVELAAEHLGRYFRVRGVVVVGDQRGRQLGFPTANLVIGDDMAMPADGVYAGWLSRMGQPKELLPAAISVGTNPTFNGLQRRVESYVLDRTDLELYGLEIAVDLVTRLRGQIVFPSVDELVAQMSQDVAQARQVLRQSA